MPDGRLYHKDCIHSVDEEHFEVENVLPCEHGVRTVQLQSGAGYYSDWSVYAQQTTVGVSNMSSQWKVPAAPDAKGPAGLGR